MLGMMFKFFLIYLVVIFFLGVFRTWRAVRRVQKNLREAQRTATQRQERSQAGVVEAEYRVLDDHK